MNREDSITELIRTWKLERKLHENVDNDKETMKV